MIAYVVTSGEYSDYSIRAVFSTKEAAEGYCERFKKSFSYNKPSVEEWEMEDETPEAHTWRGRCDYLSGEARAWNDGDDEPFPPYITDESYASLIVGRGMNLRTVHILASGRDEEHAIRRAKERRDMIFRMVNGL